MEQNKTLSFREELLLSVPDNLAVLTMDEYLMVALTKENADWVKGCIEAESRYQSKARTAIEHYAGDYSKEAYIEIIRQIAIENSTRTSKTSIACLAAYCADPQNRFMERLQDGDPMLVDSLLGHLVSQGYRRDKSLASKICRYINEWRCGGCAYTVNDSVVRAILPYYLAYYKIDSGLWKNKNFDRLSYLEFYTIYSALRDKVQVLNNHELDHLIWYAYKNDSIRSEVAKALSKVL